MEIALQTQSFLLAELKAQKKENKTQKELIEQQKKEIKMLCSRQQAGNLLFLNHIDKNCFFEFYKVKIWYQPHKKWGTGWVKQNYQQRDKTDLARKKILYYLNNDDNYRNKVKKETLDKYNITNENGFYF